MATIPRRPLYTVYWPIQQIQQQQDQNNITLNLETSVGEGTGPYYKPMILTTGRLGFLGNY